jgi:hypothetical protein
MKKSIILALTHQELIELQIIVLDADKEERLRFPGTHVKADK